MPYAPSPRMYASDASAPYQALKLITANAAYAAIATPWPEQKSLGPYRNFSSQYYGESDGDGAY